MKTIEFWLVRHGQTEENVKRILCGQQGGTLTQLGIKQAEALGKRLSAENFDQIYVSDLARTRHTFECINKYRSQKVPVEYTKLIMEKNAGDLDGQSLEVPKQLAAKQNIPFREFRPENGEAWVDVMERSKQFLVMMVKKHLLVGEVEQDKVQVDAPQLQQQQTQSNPPLKLIPPKTTNKLQNLQINNSLQFQVSIKDKKNSQIIRILGVSHGGYIYVFQIKFYNGNPKFNKVNYGEQVASLFERLCKLFNKYICNHPKTLTDRC